MLVIYLEPNIMERTYIMIKPDGVQRGFIGRIISRFEDKGFRLAGLKMLLAEESVLDEHYAELKVLKYICIILRVQSIFKLRRIGLSTPGCWSTSSPGRWWRWSGRGWGWFPLPGRCWEPPTRPTLLQGPSGQPKKKFD